MGHTAVTEKMKFLRITKGCSLRYQIKNEDIWAELNVFEINKKIDEHIHLWKEHINRIENTRLVKEWHTNPEEEEASGAPGKGGGITEDGTGFSLIYEVKMMIYFFILLYYFKKKTI